MSHTQTALEGREEGGRERERKGEREREREREKVREREKGRERETFVSHDNKALRLKLRERTRAIEHGPQTASMWCGVCVCVCEKERNRKVGVWASQERRPWPVLPV